MDGQDESEKCEKIRSFVADDQKFVRTVGMVQRILKGSSYGACERALTAEDVVLELVLDALTDCGKWDMEKVPDFGCRLISQLKSKTFNLVRKQSRLQYLGKEVCEDELDLSTEETPLAH